MIVGLAPNSSADPGGLDNLLSHKLDEEDRDHSKIYRLIE